MQKQIDYTLQYNHDQARCRVRIYSDGRGGPATVLLTELPANTGMSITNASEEIATRLAARWQLDPKTTTWIEHYPLGVGHPDYETFDQITYTWDSDKTAYTPRWRRLTIEEVERVTGSTWATGTLIDDTNRIAEDFGFEWIQDDWEEL